MMAGRVGDGTMVTGWEEDRPAANGVNAADRAETAADAADPAAADTTDAAAATEAADTDGMAETSAAENAGISRAGGKGGRTDRGSSCESEDEFA